MKVLPMPLAGDLDKLVNAIMSKAEEEAKSVITRAKEKAEDIIKKAVEEAKREAEKKASEIVRKKRSEVLNKKKSEVATIRVEAFRKVLHHKEELIKRAFEEAKKRLQEVVKTKEYEERLIEMLKEAVRVLGGGVIEIKLNERDMNLGLNLTVIAGELSRELGKPVELRLASEPGNFMGGLVAKSLEARIEVDYTIEGILERKWERLRSEVAKLLFSET
jgi:vacuolar-type H+-ATPase subunit E/Vma4